MEAPAELLAALSALVTALALLLAWLLVRRGPVASSDPAPTPPEPAPQGEASGTPAPSGPGAPEPVAAPEGPEESEGPGESAGRGDRAGPAEAEEQAAEARQVRTPEPLPIPVGFPLGSGRPLPPPAEPGPGLPASGRVSPGRTEPAAGRKGGSGAQTHHRPPQSDAEGRACPSCVLLFCLLSSSRPPRARSLGSLLPGTVTVVPQRLSLGAHPPSPPRPLTGSRIHVRVAYFKASYESCLACEKNKNTFLTGQ